MAKQAVVIVHGMGEQRPLDTLTRFVKAALPPDEDGAPTFYSRPEHVTGSFESRRFLTPRTATRPQTEFFEYHWADRMQGNRIDDLWPTFRRMVLCRPQAVPAGLRGVWVVAWALILAAAWAVAWGPLQGVWRSDDGLVDAVVGALVSGGLTAAVVSYVVSRLLPGWLTASFVDVVRYLDTSPRSYGVRREVRRGLIEMLQALRDATDHRGRPAYDRVVVVAHSLGGFIAYDAISHVWGTTNTKAHAAADGALAGREELTAAADGLLAGTVDAAGYQRAQGPLSQGLRAQGNPWNVSDLVTLGTPMYFADRLLSGRGDLAFGRRRDRHELVTCPPLWRDGATVQPRLSWWRKVEPRCELLHEAAPFAVVRWTNLYFPTRWGLLGDWFGGRLQPLFGPGVRDVEVTGNLPWRLTPAWPHSAYFRFPTDTSDGSATALLRDVLALDTVAPATPTRRQESST